jgi:hypothetical protein
MNGAAPLPERDRYAAVVLASSSANKVGGNIRNRIIPAFYRNSKKTLTLQRLRSLESLLFFGAVLFQGKNES